MCVYVHTQMEFANCWLIKHFPLAGAEPSVMKISHKLSITVSEFLGNSLPRIPVVVNKGYIRF